MNIELATLLDMLAENTRQYTQLMSEGFKNGEEFSHIEQKILSLQLAIRAKQDFQNNQTVTDNVKFEVLCCMNILFLLASLKKGKKYRFRA